jgi:hypothetical protein
MSEIEKLLMADHGSTEIRMKRMELLWEMHEKTNLIVDEKNQKLSVCVPTGPLYDVECQGELYELGVAADSSGGNSMTKKTLYVLPDYEPKKCAAPRVQEQGTQAGYRNMGNDRKSK